jgi:hypothetical protein
VRTAEQAQRLLSARQHEGPWLRKGELYLQLPYRGASAFTRIASKAGCNSCGEPAMACVQHFGDGRPLLKQFGHLLFEFGAGSMGERGSGLPVRLLVHAVLSLRLTGKGGL